jgi:hypothetical protein
MLDSEMAAKGFRGASYASPLYQAAIAVHHAVYMLETGDWESIPRKVIVPAPFVTKDNVKMAETGSAEELAKGDINSFPPDWVSPGFYPDFYHPKWTQGVDIQVALTGLVPSEMLEGPPPALPSPPWPAK